MRATGLSAFLFCDRKTKRIPFNAINNWWDIIKEGFLTQITLVYDEIETNAETQLKLVTVILV